MKLSEAQQSLPPVIGIMGGSFDPPHLGHLLAARWALHYLGPMAAVWIIPAGDHPFGKRLTSAEHRLAMCALTFRDERLVVSPLEIDRAARLNQPTYTVDTLRELRHLHPEVSLRLILGTDVMTETSRWRAWDEVASLAPALWVPREGFHDVADDCASDYALGDSTAGSAHSPPRPPGISSREIRQMLRDGRDVSPFLAPGVLEYLRDQRLYPMMSIG